jgi:PAS domain S-box-containing protein
MIVNITEYKNVEYTALLGYWEFDIQKNVLFWSDEIYRIFEIDPTQFDASYDAFLNAIHPDDREFVKRAYKESVTNRTPFNIEHRVLLNDGRIKFVHNQCHTNYDELGDPVRSIGTVQDIAERKQAEEALRKSEARYRNLFEGIPVGLYQATLEGQILDVNRALLEMLGYPDRETALAVNAPDWYANPADWARCLALIDNQDSVFDYEARWRRKDGTTIWVKDTVRTFYDSCGHVLHYEGALVDITENKRTEEELQKYADQMELLNKVTMVITTSLALEEVFRSILEQIQAIVSMNSGAILLKEENRFRVVLDWGFTPSMVGNKLLEDDELFGEGISGKELFILDNPLNHPHFNNWSGSVGIQSWMCVPFVVRGELIGCISLNSKTPKAYTPDHIPLVNAFAAQAAQAIDNARLFGDAKRRLERLASLRNIDRAINNSFDLRITLDVILYEVLTQLKVDAAVVLVYHPEILTLEFLAGRGFRTNALQFTNLHLGQGYAGNAALERRSIYIPDLNHYSTDFLRSPRFPEEQFISYYGIPLIAKGEIIGVLEIFQRSPLNPNIEWLEFADTLAGQAAIAIDNINLFDKLRLSNMEIVQAYDKTIEGWARALELRDMETKGHSWRVMDLTMQLAHFMEVSEQSLIHVRRGALLHDIGKIGVPDKILQKPGPLDEEEWEIMHKHPLYAFEWLSSSQYLRPTLDIPYCHHEKWDGSGYPRGLKGEQIPLPARIFAIVDVYDALRSDRPYRQAWSKEKTLQYIQEQAGSHFDPEVVKAFFTVIET